MSNEITNKFDEHLIKPDVIEQIWFEDSHGVVSWNGENNIDDLLNGDGNTYSGEIRIEGIEIDGHVLYTLNNDCGGEEQVIFSIANKIDPKDYE